MKITSFNPNIMTNDADAVAAVFEALGFVKKHQPTGQSSTGNQYKSYRMVDANDFHVDITSTSVARDRDAISIRINVDNYEEAYDMLIARGFTDTLAGRTTNTGSAKATALVAPSGFVINLIQHIK